MLNEMRFGKLNLSSVKKFKSLTRPLDESNGIVPTELFVYSTLFLLMRRSPLADFQDERTSTERTMPGSFPFREHHTRLSQLTAAALSTLSNAKSYYPTLWRRRNFSFVKTPKS
jgi:hypothetical protein